MALYGEPWVPPVPVMRPPLSHSLERVQFGKPLAAFQLTQAKLVDMAVEIEKGMLLAYHLGRLKETGRLTSEQVSVGKLNSTARGTKDRPQRPHHPGRERGDRRLPGHAPRGQSGIGAHLRRHV